MPRSSEFSDSAKKTMDPINDTPEECRATLDGAQQILDAASLQSDGLHIDLLYPRCIDSVKQLVVGLVDIRAADSIRVSYDFERDGWQIEQASTFQWAADDEVCDPDWQEVAFIRAWAREKPSNGSDLA